MRTAKHGSCLAHPKLPCGCKCCETNRSTVHTDPAGLAEFHAYIHAAQAQRGARPRLAGDGAEHPYRNPLTGGEWEPGVLRGGGSVTHGDGYNPGSNYYPSACRGHTCPDLYAPVR